VDAITGEAEQVCQTNVCCTMSDKPADAISHRS